MPERNRRSTRNSSTNKKLNRKKENKEKKQKNPKTKSKAKKIILWTVVGLLVVGLIAAGILAGVIFGIFQKYSIPIDKLRISTENTVVLDSDGNVIATLSADEKRESIKIGEMAKYLPTAFIAIEDERFYEHQGIDLKRTAAATFSYVFKGNSSFGGSTITQQLVKNITKEDERDATRKIKEMARAYNLEKTLTKDEILELYLNLIFMGEDVYGVQMASKLYFNKSASELDLAECAFIAGINNSPNAYKPFEDNAEMKEKIKTRTLTVIEKMHELGKIETEEEYNVAVEKVKNGLTFTRGEIAENIYSYHTDAAIEQIIADLQEANPDMTRKAAEFYVYNGGLTIYSTQVTSIQDIMEAEYLNTKHLIKSSKNYIKDAEGNDTEVRATTQSAMVIIDHKTGQVVATVGGFGEKTARGLNRATQGKKQPGSSIKPLAVIGPSLEEGLITAGTVVDDTPISGMNVKNSGGGYTGLMTVRDIIRVSRNIPEIKMIKNLGPEKSVEYLKQFGISTVDERDANPATALGGITQGVSVLEMTAAYATIANDGVYIEPKFYTKVVDSNGNVVLEANQETRRVMSADNAYILKSILKSPVSGGTATGAAISGMDVAAKTGTTDKFTERWLCGFTPYYTAATWYGYDLTERISNGGVNTAMKIWGSVMRKVHSGLESKRFQKTGNIVSASICKDSGLIKTELCEQDPRGSRVYSEVFVKGTVPSKSCTVHVKENVCIGEDGTIKLATEFCPEVQEMVFITRENSDTDRAWEKAADAKYMLPEVSCEVHVQTEVPSPSPEASPTPGTDPSATPSSTPTEAPTTVPTTAPTVVPTTTPTSTPTEAPTTAPTTAPTVAPTTAPEDSTVTP